MPTVTYRGEQKAGRNMGPMGYWIWGKPEHKSQEWVDEFAKGLTKDFLVDGVPFVLPASEDEGNDGIPDMKWTKGDIMTWLDDEGVEYSALNTKAKLLAKVDEHLNPTEDSMSEDGMEDTTGDE